MSGSEFAELKNEVKFSVARNVFMHLIDEYEEANPELFSITLMQIYYEALEVLKGSIEDPGMESVTWDYPFVTIAYPLVNTNVKEDGNIEMMKVKLTLEDVHPEISAEKLIENLYEWKRFHVFELMTRHIVNVKMGDRYGFRLPQYLQDAVDELPENERQKAIEDLTTMPVIDDLKINYEAKDKKGRTHKGQGTILFQINPLFIDVDGNEGQEGFYPVDIGIEFKGFKPSKWDKENKEHFWKTLLDSVMNMIPEEHWDFLNVEEDSAQKPEVRAELQKPLPPVKASMYLEHQKFATSKQLTFDDYIQDQALKERAKETVEVMGIDVTSSTEKAIHAIQKMLTETNYKGNTTGDHIQTTGRGFNFTGYLPALEFTKSQYFEAYGVNKVITDRGTLEYSGYERKEAIDALMNLATKPCLFVYIKEKWVEIGSNRKNGKPRKEKRYDRVETISPLIQIKWGWEDLTQKESETVSKRETTESTEKKFTMAITPAPVMVEDIHNYFVLKPADLYTEISLKFPKSSKFTYRFIDWLIMTAEEKARHRDKESIKINYQSLGRTLRMDSYINSRNWKGLRKTLTSCYDVAIKLEYLQSYNIDVQGKNIDRYDEFMLNLEKFERLRKKIEELPAPGK